jgi:hypothetical protein
LNEDKTVPEMIKVHRQVMKNAKPRFNIFLNRLPWLVGAEPTGNTE